jgi:hypothetical protein
MRDEDESDASKTSSLEENRENGKSASEDSLVEKVKTFAAVLEALYSLGKFAIIIVILSVAWSYRSEVGDWIRQSTHVSAFGISIDHQNSAKDTIDHIISISPTRIDKDVLLGAIARATRNWPTIVGSRVLWVDDNPGNNWDEESIMRDMGIDVWRATSTPEALTLIPSFAPDIIISNVVRRNDVELPLANCPAHYFQVPSGVKKSLEELNSDTMAGRGIAGGLSMAEAISKQFTDNPYTNHDSPRILFYSYSNGGGVVASQCARIATNRVDVLFQNLVSALEEIRWQKLKQLAPI